MPMTTARFERNGGRFRVAIDGHAGYGDYGSDIVCAACSTLGYTLMQQAAAMHEAGALREMRQEHAAGHILLDFEAREGAEKAVEAAVQTILGGFALLAEKYPDYVRLEN